MTGNMVTLVAYGTDDKGEQRTATLTASDAAFDRDPGLAGLLIEKRRQSGILAAALLALLRLTLASISILHVETNTASSWVLESTVFFIVMIL